jgi:hypothetical protein
MSENRFQSFSEFYPYYLLEHSHPACRALHYFGSVLVIITLLYAITNGAWQALWLLPLIGYGFAWVGHFFIEHNKPATFKYPFYSLAADWVMLKDFLTGQLVSKLASAQSASQTS